MCKCFPTGAWGRESFFLVFVSSVLIVGGKGRYTAIESTLWGEVFRGWLTKGRFGGSNCGEWLYRPGYITKRGVRKERLRSQERKSKLKGNTAITKTQKVCEFHPTRNESSELVC